MGFVFEALKVSTPDSSRLFAMLSDAVPERGVPDGFSVNKRYDVESQAEVVPGFAGFGIGHDVPRLCAADRE